MRLFDARKAKCLTAALVVAFSSAAPAADPPKPATSMQKAPPELKVPDLSFHEVQMSYPDLNISFRLVPAGATVSTSILKLVQTLNVPPGTSMGPAEPSGQPGPVAWRSCKTPLKAKLGVWVTNGGKAAFDATTPAFGLTGKIDATAVSSAFGKVAAGQTQNFDAGAFSLSPGNHSASLVLNKAHGGGELNFGNNALDSKFQITCTVPSPAPARPPR